MVISPIPFYTELKNQQHTEVNSEKEWMEITTINEIWQGKQVAQNNIQCYNSL